MLRLRSMNVLADVLVALGRYIPLVARRLTGRESGRFDVGERWLEWRAEGLK